MKSEGQVQDEEEDELKDEESGCFALADARARQQRRLLPIRGHMQHILKTQYQCLMGAKDACWVRRMLAPVVLGAKDAGWVLPCFVLICCLAGC